MKGDTADSTFEKKKRYVKVLMQQGRVQLDADWNEQINNATKARVPFCIVFMDKYGKELVLKSQSIDSTDCFNIEFPDRFSISETFEAALEAGQSKLTLRLKENKPKVDKPDHSVPTP